MQLGLIFSAKNDPICITYFQQTHPGANPERTERLLRRSAYLPANTANYEDALALLRQHAEVSPKANASALYKQRLRKPGYTWIKLRTKPSTGFRRPSRPTAAYCRPRYYNRGYAYELKKNVNRARQGLPKRAPRVDPEHKLAEQGLKRVGPQRLPSNLGLSGEAVKEMTKFVAALYVRISSRNSAMFRKSIPCENVDKQINRRRTQSKRWRQRPVPHPDLESVAPP
ncbi:hypothetical protein FQR65_LT20796 [Abscondita terminalis]|nr:hypothetical protein FQR65_LT20796 [Abscondita terminalis]